jgi:hypothetical protein
MPAGPWSRRWQTPKIFSPVAPVCRTRFAMLNLNLVYAGWAVVPSLADPKIFSPAAPVRRTRFAMFNLNFVYAGWAVVPSLADPKIFSPAAPVCRTRFAMPTGVDQVFQDHHLVSGQALPGRATLGTTARSRH